MDCRHEVCEDEVIAAVLLPLKFVGKLLVLIDEAIRLITDRPKFARDSSALSFDNSLGLGHRVIPHLEVVSVHFLGKIFQIL